MSAIFDFSFFQTWGIIRSSLIGLPDLENMSPLLFNICLEILMAKAWTDVDVGTVLSGFI